ncbi:MAG: patatin-like phospholipase family protein [Tannerella sp.]|jgi:NTE family protein|nr:patatin-like phospholipase family protein [Tannerella sp.]
MSIFFKRKPYTVGLALSGGGAKGFAHIGVFQALDEFGIRPDIISGTSVGALMGALYADGYPAGEIRQLFNGREFTEFAQLQLPKSGIFDSSRFSLFLEERLRARQFEELQIPLIVTATDLDNGKGRAFTSGPMVETVRASCSVPVLFSPVLIDGVHYVDGGLFHNFPVSFIRPQCEYVIGVNVSPYVPREYSQNLYSIAERSFHYLFLANTNSDRRNCDILIETEAFGQYKMFDLKNVDRMVESGYRTALDAMERFLTDRKKKAQARQFLQKFPKLQKFRQIHP